MYLSADRLYDSLMKLYMQG